MAVVQTIAGPVESAALGRTLAHEHICSGMAGMERSEEHTSELQSH